MNKIVISKRKHNNLYEEISDEGVILRNKTALPEDIREDVIKIMKYREHNKETFYQLEQVIKLFKYNRIVFKGK